MLLRTGLLVGILLFAASISAQTTGDRDPISGDWGTDSRRLLQLKFDGKQTVTGTVFLFMDGKQRSSAAIKTGSFDPRNRLLKLAGEIAGPDGKSTPYVIEGTLEKDTLSVAYKFGSNEGIAALQKL